MTGRRLLIQILSYDYTDIKLARRRKGNTRSQSNRKWSKLSRSRLKQMLHKQIKTEEV